MTSIQTHLPYDYYYLKFCRAKEPKKKDGLMKALFADQESLTPYKVQMNKNTTIGYLCKQSLSNADAKNFAWMIENDYKVRL